MNNDQIKTMKTISGMMKLDNISLTDFMVFNMEKVMNEEGTDLDDIPSVLHGLSRNVVGRLAPE